MGGADPAFLLGWVCGSNLSLGFPAVAHLGLHSGEFGGRGEGLGVRNASLLPGCTHHPAPAIKPWCYGSTSIFLG